MSVMTQWQINLSRLREILRALGLSSEAVEDIIEHIVNLLSDPQEQDTRSNIPIGET